MLGFFYICVFIAIILVVCWFVLAKVAPRVNGRSRDRRVETDTRLRMRDSETRQRVADQVRREQGE